MLLGLAKHTYLHNDVDTCALQPLVARGPELHIPLQLPPGGDAEQSH